MSQRIISFNSSRIARSRDESAYPDLWPDAGGLSLIEGGGSTAFDWSGNGNTGTLTNGPTWENGLAGTCASFDGVNDYIALAQRAIVSATAAEFSVSLWCYKLSSSGRTAFYHGAAYGEFIVGIGVGFIPSGHVGFAVDLVSYSWKPLSAGVCPLNQWFHLVGVYRRGGVCEVYLNGTLANSLSVPFDALNNTVPYYSSIGSYGTGISSFWDGSVDDVRVYNRALSSSEIRDLYLLRPKSFLIPRRKRSRFANLVNSAKPWIYRSHSAAILGGGVS